MFFYDLKNSVGLSPSLSSQVAREIGRRIVAGTHAPGSLLEDEGSLAVRYQVSRSVVRDAIKVLVGKGLLEVRRGIGTRVRPRSQWGLLDDDVMAWTQSAPPSTERLIQLLEIRQVIEPKAARWAAERATPKAIGEIEAAIEKMESEQGEVMQFVAADASFHRAILHAANNEFLSAMEGLIFSALLSSIQLTNSDPRDNKDSIPYHRRVFEAIKKAKANTAEKAMSALLQDALERLQQRVGK